MDIIDILLDEINKKPIINNGKDTFIYDTQFLLALDQLGENNVLSYITGKHKIMKALHEFLTKLNNFKRINFNDHVPTYFLIQKAKGLTLTEDEENDYYGYY